MQYRDDDDLWNGDCFVVKHRVNAMLVNHDNEEHWIPYSQIHDDSELYESTPINEDGNLVIPYWLAKKAGWV